MSSAKSSLISMVRDLVYNTSNLISEVDYLDVITEFCGDLMPLDRIALLTKRQLSEAPLSNDGALAEG